MVPLTSQELRSPCYRFFLRSMAEPPEHILRAGQYWTEAGKALLPHELNELFRGEEGKMENGISRLADGCAALALTVDMPGVTVEMVDWWYTWHLSEPMRFKMWNPEAHYDCRLLASGGGSELAPGCCRDRVCEIVEDFGFGPEKSLVHYRHPEDFGFEPRLLESFGGALICAGDAVSPAIALHFFVPTERGGVMKSRIWLGFCMEKDGPRRRLPHGARIPFESAAAHYRHVAYDLTRLTALLPELYEQFGKEA